MAPDIATSNIVDAGAAIRRKVESLARTDDVAPVSATRGIVDGPEPPRLIISPRGRVHDAGAPRARKLACAGALAACWLAASGAAVAETLTILPGQGDSAVEDLTPAPLVARPRPAMVWEAVDLANVTSRVNSHLIYLNRCTGAGCVIVQGVTNSTTDPVHSSIGRGVLSAFSRSDAVWNTVVECMKDVFAPFDVQITEVDPGTQPHFEIIFGGMPQQIGLQAGVGGVSPFSCAPYIPNSVVFVFDVWGDDPEELCATAAQEVAHSFALDHAIEPSDPMTYFGYTGRRRYMNAQIQCGSDCDKDHRSPLGAQCTGPDLQWHECACGNGAQTQNDFQAIASLFGDGSAVPPTVKIAAPQVGDTVEPGFAISVEVTSEAAVESVELRVDGQLLSTLDGAPYAATGPAALVDGTHTIEATAYDSSGAAGRARTQVIVGPGCKVPSDCPGDGDTCVGGRCVAGPRVAGGMGTTCSAAVDCRSWQCANDNGAKYCVEACKPGQCPSNFGCRDDGMGGGVCWPGFDEGSAGCATLPGPPPLGSIALGLGFALIVLRRRRPR